ncbi:hypothetical protein BIW11_08528 [Tropilaelaps mercedesae]|uniref:Uncharacterized protein n=1 Tax=Tropilaelaps mercedesae TaxID=418985 RepID=A0A1V9XPK6_9ACAR|nr:hypothetical protein BIW11_08528 [Tropilaelaps mercedesae]
MPQHSCKKQDVEKTPRPAAPVVQTENTPQILPKEPTLTLRLRLRPQVPIVAQTPTTAVSSSANQLQLVNTSNTQQSQREECIEQRHPGRSIHIVPEAKITALQPPFGSEHNQSTSSSEHTTADQVLPSALRKPNATGVASRKNRSDTPRVSFEKGTLVSSKVPKGVPCCVHPRLFKNGQCEGPVCKDENVSIEEVERLLGIKVDQFITDEEYARMRERIEAMSTSEFQDYIRTAASDAFSTESASLDATDNESPWTSKSPEVLRAKDDAVADVMKQSVGALSPSKTAGPDRPPAQHKPPSVEPRSNAGQQVSPAHTERKVTFGPDVADHVASRTPSVQRCLHPRRLSRDLSMDQNMSVEEVESLLGINLGEVVPDPNDPLGTKAPEGHKHWGEHP